MVLKFDLFQVFLFAFCVYLKCVFTLDVQSDRIAGKDTTKEVLDIKPSTVHLNPLDALSVDKKSDTVIGIPLSKPVNGMGQSESQGSALNKGTSQLVLEGGGIVDLTSTAQPDDGLLDVVSVDDANHSKGSKPRKGVHHPGSSVVPRKGVDPQGAFSFNQSSVGVTPDPTNNKESTNSIGENKMPLNKTEPEQQQKVKPEQQQLSEKSPPKVTHKKPVVVTDIEDIDDFEKYPIIQTSTTGEDYIIIGIVIVLGIWCSIFGALIFYRRAGEYWDRRHYRRMDFLVEGMYND